MLPRLVGCTCLFVVYLASEASFAGPPFLTDDPVPVEQGRWEINNFSAGTLVKGAFAGTLPGIDANYGPVENIQLHLLASLGVAQSGGSNPVFGPSDTEIGVKYRFLPAKQTDWWPQIGFYPFLDFPTGSADRGLGTGRTHAFFPIWLQKDFGKWSTYGGGGYWINPGPGNRNFWFTGWVLQYQVSDSLALGAEIFHETSSSTSEPGSPGFPLGTKNSTGFNFGGTYDFNKTYHLLFSFGRGLENASVSNAFSYYLALRLTY